MGEEEKDSLAYTYTQETSLHGIGRAANKDKSLVKRGIWILFFLACFGLFMYFLCDALIRYYNYPVSTKLTYNTEANLDFPSVTICNYNKATASYLAAKNDPMLNATVEYFDSAVPTKPSKQLQEYMKTLDMKTLYENGAHQFDDTFMGCSFVGVEMENLRPGQCGFPAELMVTTRTQMGICYTFHPYSYVKNNGTLKSKRAGNTGGLTIIMNIAQEEYRLGGFSGGMKVLVHDPSERPRVLELGSGLEPGTDVYMAVKKYEMVNLPHPYARKEDSCVDTKASDYVNPLKYSDRYSHAACLEEDIVDVQIESCGCVDYLYIAPGVRVCNAYEVDTCINPALMDYYLNGSTANCPKPCDDIKYEVAVSQSFYPNEYKVSSIAESLGVSEDYFAKNIVSLNVYFGELEYTKIEQEPAYSFITAVAGIGGYLGLCLGASFLTVLEVVELFWDYCAQWNSRRKAGRRNKVDDTKPDGKTNEAWKTEERKPEDYPQFQDYAM